MGGVIRKDKKKILIADDDSGIVDALSYMLEYAGFAPLLLLSADDIHAQVQEQKPDLILLDIWLSHVDGRDVCRKLKSDNTTNTIPIVLLSAHKNTEEAAREVGADAYVEKPFEMNKLLEVIEELT